MKAIAALIAMVGFAFSGLANAAGMHLSGYVNVINGATSSYMYGQYNVRYNATIAGAPYISADSFAAGSVYFSGANSAGTYFACYVSTSSPFYQAAVEIKNSLGNGSYLFVARVAASNECISVYSKQVSHALD